MVTIILTLPQECEATADDIAETTVDHDEDA